MCAAAQDRPVAIVKSASVEYLEWHRLVIAVRGGEDVVQNQILGGLEILRNAARKNTGALVGEDAEICIPHTTPCKRLTPNQPAAHATTGFGPPETGVKVNLRVGTKWLALKDASHLYKNESSDHSANTFKV